MKENTTKKRKALYYVILAISALLLTAATVLTVYFVTGGQDPVLENPDDTPTEPVGPSQPSEPSEPEQPSGPVEPDEPTGGEDAVRFTNPVAALNLTGGYGFYHNQTLGWFYEHEGVDITAEEGTQVLAMADGIVESITADELTGTQIVIDHGNGLKTLYRFVNAGEWIAEGSTVKKGDVIATVAAATGVEYKDGSHLHLEVTVDGNNVDPTEYLTLEEK